MELPFANLVTLDEGHNETGIRAQQICDYYEDRSVPCLYFTATPIGMQEHKCTKLIVAGTKKEMRTYGALVPAHTKAPCELDYRCFRDKLAKGIFQFRDEIRGTILPVLFGKVIENYKKFNPSSKPTILFAPSVADSRWFCDQFNKSGFPWSHIDAKSIIINGEELPSNIDNRELLVDSLKSGKTLGVSNRFVLREGVDFGFLECCILACTFGSLKSYLQAGGRMLRSYPGKGHCTILDHGGNWHRHCCSLNDDHNWSLEDTEQTLREKGQELYRTKAVPEPIVCPKCSGIRRDGSVCPHCGYTYKHRRREVIQVNGEIAPIYGDIYRVRKVDNSPDAHKAWAGCYFRCLKAKKDLTFRQVLGLYRKENYGHDPDPASPYMPLRKADWFAPVKSVPRDQLSSKSKFATS